MYKLLLIVNRIHFTILTVVGMVCIIGGMAAPADATLDDIRATVIKSGVIPDTYLIEPTGTYWESRNMAESIKILNEWILSKDTTIPSERFQVEVKRATFNTAILLEGRIDVHHVTALVVSQQRALNTYDANTPEYLKKYHDHVISTFDIPTTTSSINATIHQKLGDMAPLADNIVRITHDAVSIGSIPDALFESDIEYWFGVELATYCSIDGGSWGDDGCVFDTEHDALVAVDSILSYHSTLSWRSSPCYKFFYNPALICNGSSFHVVGTKNFNQRVTGNTIYVALSVRSSTSDKEGSLDIQANTGVRGSFFDSGSGKSFTLSGTAKAYDTGKHPCNKPGRGPDHLAYCISSSYWTASGTSTIKNKPTDPDPDPDPTTPTNNPPTANAGKD